MNPLQGVKVLDLTSYFSGPFCTRTLGDLGAEIIKIENPPLGDSARFTMVLGDHSSAIYTSRNRGKKSIVLNMKDERQKEIFLKMVETADIVVSNFKTGGMEKLGLGYEVLKERNPAIVYTMISGFGQDGPWKNRTAFDGVVQAASGVVSVTGEPGGEPVKTGFSLADAVGGAFGAIATLAALFDAKRTGVGRKVDVSMLDALFAMEETLVANYFMNGKIPRPIGSHHTTACPFGPYTFKDGEQLFITCGTDNSFRGLCEVLGRPDLCAEDSKFYTMNGRMVHREELDKIIIDLLMQYDSKEFSEMMLAHRLPFGPIYNIKQIAESDVMAARDMVVTAKYPTGQTYRVTGNPIKMSDMERQTEFEAYPLGYHTMEVLKDYVDEQTLHEIFDPVLDECQKACDAKYEKSKA